MTIDDKRLTEAVYALEESHRRLSRPLYKRQRRQESARERLHEAVAELLREARGEDGEDDRAESPDPYEAGVHEGLRLAYQVADRMYHTTRQPKVAEALRGLLEERTYHTGDGQESGQPGEPHPDTESVNDGEPDTSEDVPARVVSHPDILNDGEEKVD